MKRAFVITHWAFTLLLAPFVSQAIQYFWGTNPHEVVGLLEVYPVTLLFSAAFSFPTFLIYVICFRFLSRQPVNSVLAKFILITVSVLGIFVTQTIIKGSMTQDIIMAYSTTTIMVGLVLTLKDRTTKVQEF